MFTCIDVLLYGIILMQVVVPKSSGKEGLCEAKGKTVLNLSDEGAQDKTGHSDGLPDIEQLIKEKTFSR